MQQKLEIKSRREKHLSGVNLLDIWWIVFGATMNKAQTLRDSGAEQVYGLIPCVRGMKQPTVEQLNVLADDLVRDTSVKLEYLERIEDVTYENFMRPYVALETRYKTLR